MSTSEKKDLSPEQRIGREIFSRRLRREILDCQEEETQPPPQVFGPTDASEISVDCVDCSVLQELTEIGDRINEQKRASDPELANSRFRGWIAFLSCIPMENGWRVVASPMGGSVQNMYHADMLVPEMVHDESLSYESHWFSCVNDLCCSLVGEFEWVERFGDAPDK